MAELLPTPVVDGCIRLWYDVNAQARHTQSVDSLYVIPDPKPNNVYNVANLSVGKRGEGVEGGWSSQAGQWERCPGGVTRQGCQGQGHQGIQQRLVASDQIF